STRWFARACPTASGAHPGSRRAMRTAPAARCRARSPRCSAAACRWKRRSTRPASSYAGRCSPRRASAPGTARWGITPSASSAQPLVDLVEVGDALPRVLGGLAPADQLEVARRDHPFAGERAEVDHPCPELLAEQQERDRFHLAGLDQRQRLE